ncbi:MAG: hypothetical protein H3C60_13515, partial [Sphingomonadaceae bacterium]|nr:hypothetical protein [Sphingomonadaceae bacterium]
MSGIRPLRADDIGALAALFQEVFRDRAAPPPASLAAYLRWHYLDMPGCDPEIAPLVHAERDGRVTGFIGVNAQAMIWGGRTLRAGIASALM